jgi:hypothetical protein
MCIPGVDPITLGLVLTGASVGSNYIGAQKAERARDSALAAETQRQKDLQREAEILNDQSRDRYEDFDGQQDEKATKLTDYFAEAPQSAAEAVGEANATAASALPSTENGIVQREIDKQTALADAFTGQQADARGRLRSFGDVLGGVSREQARDAGLIGQIGGFQRGSSNVLPYELEDANNKGSGFRLLGDILGGLGSIGLTSGVTAAAKAGTTPGWLGGGKIGGLL